MRQVEKLYVTSTFTKQAAPSGLVGGLIGAGAGGVGTYLVSKGDWRKRLRNALIGAGVGGAGGAGLEYVYRKRTDKAKPAISQKIKNVAADLVIKRELEKARRGAPDARVYVGPETPLTPVDLDREAKELNASRDLAALLEQQNRPEVAAAHQRVLDRVAEADKKMRAIRKAENDHRVAAGHARRRARLDAAAAKAEKARRTVLLRAGARQRAREAGRSFAVATAIARNADWCASRASRQGPV